MTYNVVRSCYEVVPNPSANFCKVMFMKLFPIHQQTPVSHLGCYLEF